MLLSWSSLLCLVVCRGSGYGPPAVDGEETLGFDDKFKSSITCVTFFGLDLVHKGVFGLAGLIRAWMLLMPQPECTSSGRLPSEVVSLVRERRHVQTNRQYPWWCQRCSAKALRAMWVATKVLRTLQVAAVPDAVWLQHGLT